MRTPIALATLALLAACGGGDAPATDDAMEDAMSAPMESTTAAEAGPTLSDFAGEWELTATLEGAAEPVPVRLQGDATGAWTMMLEGRDPMMASATVVGDSLVMEVAEYESVLREGVMVSTRSAVVMEGEMMMGNLVATYTTPEGEEVVSGTLSGTRGGM